MALLAFLVLGIGLPLVILVCVKCGPPRYTSLITTIAIPVRTASTKSRLTAHGAIRGVSEEVNLQSAEARGDKRVWAWILQHPAWPGIKRIGRDVRNQRVYSAWLRIKGVYHVDGVEAKQSVPHFR